MKVRIHTPLRATEDADRVRAAATRWFPGDVVEDEGLTVLHDELETLRARVWELHIIDTFRGQALAGLHSDRRGFSLALSKQAALAGIVSFPVGDHPLGHLQVDVRLEDDPWEDAEALIWHLAPATEDGKIVDSG